MSSELRQDTPGMTPQLSSVTLAGAAIPWLEQHYWVFDLVRGLALIALVAMGIASPKLFVQVLFVGVGAFLIVDGALHIVSGALTQHGTSGVIARYGVGLLGIGVGIGVIVAHSLVAVGLVSYLGVRLILQGIVNGTQSIAWLTLRQKLSWYQVGEGERWLWLAGLAR